MTGRMRKKREGKLNKSMITEVTIQVPMTVTLLIIILSGGGKQVLNKITKVSTKLKIKSFKASGLKFMKVK